MIKKILSLCLCMVCFFMISGCEEETKQFDYQKNYVQKDKIELRFKAMEFTKSIAPINKNTQYYEIQSDDSMTIIDAQFYVENKQNKKVHLNKLMNAKLQIEDEYVEAKLYVENETYTDFFEDAALSENQNTIVHAAFYVYDDELKAMKKEKSFAEITIFDETYQLPIKAKATTITPISANQPIQLKALTMNIISHTIDQTIKPLYYDVVHSRYLTSENPDHLLIGVFAEMENTSDTNIDLMKYLALELTIDKNPSENIHITLLSEDTSQFIDSTIIPAHSKCKVLFYKEIPLDENKHEYSYQFSVDGIPYTYTFNNN